MTGITLTLKRTLRTVASAEKCVLPGRYVSPAIALLAREKLIVMENPFRAFPMTLQIVDRVKTSVMWGEYVSLAHVPQELELHIVMELLPTLRTLQTAVSVAWFVHLVIFVLAEFAGRSVAVFTSTC